MDLNRITLIGRMGSDLTPKTIGEGEAAKQIVSFRFAVNSPSTNRLPGSPLSAGAAWRMWSRSST